MPILIKSSKGSRSCAIMKPKTQSPLLEDIIEALKGMTLKLEVRVTDIVQTEGPGDENGLETASAESDLKESNTKDSLLKKSILKGPSQVQLSPREPSPKAPVPRGASPRSATPKDPVLRDPPPRKPATREPIQNEPFFTEPAVKDSNPRVTSPSGPSPRALSSRDYYPVESGSHDHREEVLTRRLGKLLVRTEPEKIILPPQVVVKKATPKVWTSKVRTGTIKVGSTMKSMCISVVMDAKQPTAFIPYDDTELSKLTNNICDMSGDIEAMPVPAGLEVDDIVFAKSKEDNSWYRACVQSIECDIAGIYFFDWGLIEKTRTSRVRLLRVPELDPARRPACAIKVIFDRSTPSEYLDEIFKCENFFELKVEYYDDAADAYGVVVTKPPRLGQD